jgi:hypothetical protein
MSLCKQAEHELPGLDTPLRLEQAVKLAFPFGGMTVSGLRRERDRGTLATEKIAGKEFTTLRNVEEMRVKCRAQLKGPDYGSNLKSATTRGGSSGKPPGSSETERRRSARAALEQNAKALSKHLLNTLPRNTPSRETADVIPLRS